MNRRGFLGALAAAPVAGPDAARSFMASSGMVEVAPGAALGSSYVAQLVKRASGRTPPAERWLNKTADQRLRQLKPLMSMSESVKHALAEEAGRIHAREYMIRDAMGDLLRERIGFDPPPALRQLWESVKRQHSDDPGNPSSF